MRKLLNLIMVSSLILFVACQDDDTKVEETAGNIPGMGNTPGDLEVSEYNLPEGLEIVGDISGILESESTVAQEYASLKATNTSSKRFYGCGGTYIQVQLTLKNNIERRRTCFFPPGLIFKVNNNDHQHAFNLCWTWFCFEPLETRTIVLYLFCINRGRTESLVNTVYEILGKTTSVNMKWLANRCNGKRMNWECFSHNKTQSYLKSGDTYEEVAGEMQEVIWALTNGDGLTEEQEAYIDELPSLDTDQLPVGYEDIDNFEPPYYWDEYSPEYVAE